MKKKTLALILTVTMLLGTVVGGTLAYLLDTDKAVNTFTVGQVDIILNEAKVNEKGQKLDADGIVDTDGENLADRVTENTYHLIPGQTYVKDPTVTVVKDSEPSYVRMLVTFNCLGALDTLFAPDGADLMSIFGGYDDEEWIFIDAVKDTAADTVTYEFRYKETVAGEEDADKALPALFSDFTVPGEFTGEQLKTIENLEITVEGHAVQAVGFEDNAETGETAIDAAWAAFDAHIALNK